MRDGPTLLSIFAGIGGFDIAFHSAGFRTLAFVEWEPIKQHVLKQHFPGIPIFGDIDQFDCAEFLRTFGRPDIIAGGVPCQAISLLGKRLGVADPRWKWPQTIRLVSELRPRFCVFENPPAILTAGDGEAFNGIVSAMAALGYDGWWDVIPAAAFGAGHWRERLCIVFADAQGVGKRITPDQTDAIAGSRDARPESSGESHQRAFPSDPRIKPGQALNGSDRSLRSEGKAGIVNDDSISAREVILTNPDGERRSETRLGLPEGESTDGVRRQPAKVSGEELSTNANDIMRNATGLDSAEVPLQQATGIRQDHDGKLPSNTDDARSQGHSRDGAGSEGWSSPRRPIAAPHLPDLRGRVTGQDWWHEAVTGIPVLVSGLSGRLVEAASLCIGDSVVPQAWEPIAKALAEQLK